MSGDVGVVVSPYGYNMSSSQGIWYNQEKIQQVALQRCYTLRGAFMAQCFLFSPHQLDETGSSDLILEITSENMAMQ